MPVLLPSLQVQSLSQKRTCHGISLGRPRNASKLRAESSASTKQTLIRSSFRRRVHASVQLGERSALHSLLNSEDTDNEKDGHIGLRLDSYPNCMKLAETHQLTRSGRTWSAELFSKARKSAALALGEFSFWFLPVPSCRSSLPKPLARPAL